MVQTQLRHEVRTLQPGFPEGEDQADFEELVDKLDEAVGAIGAVVNVEGEVNRVFLGESIVSDQCTDLSPVCLSLKLLCISDLHFPILFSNHAGLFKVTGELR